MILLLTAYSDVMVKETTIALTCYRVKSGFTHIKSGSFLNIDNKIGTYQPHNPMSAETGAIYCHVCKPHSESKLC